jgi:hydrogenase maturation protease
MRTRGKAPVLVLGVGNALLRDDGVGLRLLADLSPDGRSRGAEIEFLDGGTQGLALLGRIASRRALLILDAVNLGAASGTVHVLREWRDCAARSATAHESNVSELLAVSTLLGECPEKVAIVGIEPLRIATGMELSDLVAQALPRAIEAARGLLVKLTDAAVRNSKEGESPLTALVQWSYHLE